MIEVVVAMTIVGLGVVTLLQIFSQGLRLQARSTVRTEEVARSVSLMDGLLAGNRLAQGSAQGRVGEKGRWSAQVRRIQDDASALNLSSKWELEEVTLEVFLSDKRDARPMELKTFRLVKKTDP